MGGKDKREALARKVRALKQKTVGNGCTEEEALAAAELLVKLLAEHNMTMDEADIREDEFAHTAVKNDDPVMQRIWTVGVAVAKLTGARYWSDYDKGAPEAHFFGFEHEVMVASYMLTICHRACTDACEEQERALALFTQVRRRRKLGAYLDGMVDRLSKRILDMIPPRPPGKGLIVLKNQLIDAELARIGIELKDARTRSSDDLDEQYWRGVRRADDVALNAAIPDNPDDIRRLT